MGLEMEGELCTSLVQDSTHPEETIRIAAADALSAALKVHPDYASAILCQLLELYEEKLFVGLFFWYFYLSSADL